MAKSKRPLSQEVPCSTLLGPDMQLYTLRGWCPVLFHPDSQASLPATFLYQAEPHHLTLSTPCQSPLLQGPWVFYQLLSDE